MGFDLSSTSSKIFDLSEDEGKRKTTMRGEGKEVFEKTKGHLRGLIKRKDKRVFEVWHRD